MSLEFAPRKSRRLLTLILWAWLGAGWMFMPSAQAQAPAQDDGGLQGKSVEINEKGDAVQTTATAATLAKTQAGPEVTSGTLRLLRTLETFHKNVKTIHAKFDQLRIDETFQEDVKSSGELWFDKPSRFCAKYADPKPMITLITGDSLYVYVKELNQADVYTFASPEERDRQLHQLLIGFGFKADDLVKQYEIHSSDEPGPAAELVKEKLNPEKTALFIIKPRPQYEETSSFKLCKVYIDKASHLPEKIWYKDPMGATMILTMKKIDLDLKLGEELFDKGKLFPKGTEFIDKGNRQ
jgi:outer membrane lipoprotein-sorting protein